MDNENGGWLSGCQIGNAVFKGDNVRLWKIYPIPVPSLQEGKGAEGGKGFKVRVDKM